GGITSARVRRVYQRARDARGGAGGSSRGRAELLGRRRRRGRRGRQQVRRDRLAAGEARVRRVVPAQLGLVVLPAQVDRPAVDQAGEVDQPEREVGRAERAADLGQLPEQLLELVDQLLRAVLLLGRELVQALELAQRAAALEHVG